MEQSISSDQSRFIIDASFDDFDAFTDAARAWKLDFMQLDRGGFDGKLRQCGMGGAQIGRAMFNRKLEQNGESPEGMLTFVIPVNRDLNLNWRRQDVGGNDLLIFSDAREMTSFSDDSFDLVTFSLEESLLEKSAELWGEARVMKLIGSREVVGLKPQACDELRAACLTYLERVAASPDEFTRGCLDKSLIDGLSSKLVQAISVSFSDGEAILEPRKRAKALRWAQDAITAYAHVPITVSQLCSITGASERTLQYAFQEKYGLTPKAYIQAYRLNRVRKVLRISTAVSHRVVDVANDWGFWHMGQFAKDYRRLFGELPSETLRGRV